jgi:hypothetical protein
MSSKMFKENNTGPHFSLLCSKVSLVVEDIWTTIYNSTTHNNYYWSTPSTVNRPYVAASTRTETPARRNSSTTNGTNADTSRVL